MDLGDGRFAFVAQEKVAGTVAVHKSVLGKRCSTGRVAEDVENCFLICVAVRAIEAHPMTGQVLQGGLTKVVGQQISGGLTWRRVAAPAFGIVPFVATAEPDTNNPIAEVSHRFPQLNVSEVARTIGINKSLLSRYIYGIKKPSAQRTAQIFDAIRHLGREMAAISMTDSAQ